MKKLLCFALISVYCELLEESSPTLFIVWNVGQGSWSTLTEPSKCLHVDMGGTQFHFISQLKKLCKNKKNYLFITHYDLDHINLIPKASSILKNICALHAPPKNLSPLKLKLLSHLKVCTELPPLSLRQIFKTDFKKQNDSNIFIVSNKILITGDAPSKLEGLLIKKNNLAFITHYVLGHHGSRTSSSRALLKHMPSLVQTLGSSFKKKYGHPHRETLERLSKAKAPLLTTENFGSIFINLY